jgi:hypothetical protein
MKKYIKLFDSLYELTFDPKDKELIYFILSMQPEVHAFEEFCYSWGIKFSLNRIGAYCRRSEFINSLIFKKDIT